MYFFRSICTNLGLARGKFSCVEAQHVLTPVDFVSKVLVVHSDNFLQYFYALWLVQGIADQQQFVQSVNAFNAPLSWLRLLKYMEALSPKTRQASKSTAFTVLTQFDAVMKNKTDKCWLSKNSICYQCRILHRFDSITSIRSRLGLAVHLIPFPNLTRSFIIELYTYGAIS